MHVCSWSDFDVFSIFSCVLTVGLMYVSNGYHERSSNIFMWVMLFLGNGILMCLYSVEYFSRKNCPPIYPVSIRRLVFYIILNIVSLVHDLTEIVLGIFHMCSRKSYSLS